MNFRKIVSGLMLVLPFLTFPLSCFAAGADWQKYVSADGSFSFHHPSLWQVKAQPAMIQIVNPLTGEECLVMPLKSNGEPAAALADRVVKALRQRLTDFQSKTLSAQDRGVLLDYTASINGKSHRGLALCVSDKSKGYWFSYSLPSPLFNLERARGILTGVSGSLAAGGASIPPAAIIPPLTPVSNSAPLPKPPEQKAAGAAEIKDPWFRPGGRGLRGYYAGSIISDDLVTTRTAQGGGVNSQVSVVSSGGDFYVAFYDNGTVRARYLVLDASAIASTYVQFDYEGTYTLSADGRLTTASLPLVNDPHTSMAFETHLVKLKLEGRYFADRDSFVANIASYDPGKQAWEALGTNKTLLRATRSRSSMIGVVRNDQGETGVRVRPK